jgi:hypothetical protein
LPSAEDIMGSIRLAATAAMESLVENVADGEDYKDMWDASGGCFAREAIDGFACSDPDMAYVTEQAVFDYVKENWEVMFATAMKGGPVDSEKGGGLPPLPEHGEVMAIQISDESCDLPMMRQKMKDAREAVAHAQRKIYELLDCPVIGNMGAKSHVLVGLATRALAHLEVSPLLEGDILDGTVSIEGMDAPSKTVTISSGTYIVAACAIQFGTNPVVGIAVSFYGDKDRDQRITTEEHAVEWLTGHGCPTLVAQTLLRRALDDG